MNTTKIQLTNFNLTKRQTSKGEDYFIIVDQETNTAYFCFENQLKNNWHYLVANWENLASLEIEFQTSEKGNKVLSLKDKSLMIF